MNAGGQATLTITDAQGQIVRTLRETAHAGLNRVYWDLRAEPSTMIRLRTPPLYAPWVKLNDGGWRPTPTGSRLSLLMPPGAYTVKLSAGSREQSRDLVVMKDPVSSGSNTDIAAQFTLLQAIRTNLNAVADMINEVELVRKQLVDLRVVVDAQGAAAQVRTVADDLEKKLIAFEGNLIQLQYTGTGQDTTRWPQRLLEKIMHLAGDLEIGDFPPTDQQREVHGMYSEQIGTHRKTLASLVQGDIATFNTMLRERGLGAIVVPRRITGTN
jgi:hypothetical protein